MSMNIVHYLAVFLLLAANTSFSKESVRFKDLTEASIDLIAGGVRIEFHNSVTSWDQDISIPSEAPLRIKVEDLNSDGYPDFSVAHLDEGMGTYSVHRVFLYSSRRKIFLEFFPKCTNEFINLKIANGYLLSSYISNGRWLQCKTFFAKSVQ